MKSVIISVLCAVLLCSGPRLASGQSKVMEDCLEAFNVQLPLYSEAYASLPTDPAQNLPVLYYLPEDQYTFWYKIESDATDTLTYKVWPTNENDQFQAVLYQYEDTAFCSHLANGQVSPKQLVRNEFVVANDNFSTEGYGYQATVESGQVYFLSVLSLNKDYCGHRLLLRFRDAQIEFHAMSKPCYNFEALDLDITETELELEEDIELDLFLEEEAAKEENEAKSTVLEPVIQPITPKESVEVEAPSEPAREPVQEEESMIASDIGRSLSSGEKLDLQEVYFYNNTYAFREDSESQLNKLYQWLKANPEVEIEIAGHTAGDTENIRPNPNFKNRGKAWNFKGSSKKLSKKRAEAVSDYLIEKGISQRRLKTKGYGDSERIVENPRTPSDHRRNMRVEVSIISD